MIVRISTEGQYELGEDAGAALNELDNQVVSACEASWSAARESPSRKMSWSALT
jgi:hypothetical protein